VAVSVLDIQVNSQGAVRNLRDVSNASKSAESAVVGLSKALGPLLIAFEAVQATKFVFAKTAELESQTKSLEVLTGSVQKATAIIKELQQLGAVTPFTSTELIDAAKRLNAFGVEAEKVVETTRRLADVSGATGAELQGLVTAYGQVQAKGRLQGEELLQFQERGIALQGELRKMYGMTGDEFQKALSKGKISAEAVEVALQRLTDTGGKYANGAIAQSETLQGKFSTLQDGVEQLARTIGTALSPMFRWALSQATQVVSEIQRLIDEANNAGGARGRELQFARNAEAAVGRMNLNPFTQQGMMADMRQRNIEQQRADFKLQQQLARKTAVVKPLGVPAFLGGTDAGGGGGTSKASTNDAENAAKAAAKESERVGQVIRDRLAEGELLRIKSGLQDKIAAAEASGDRMLAARLQGLQKEIDIQYQYAQALAQEKNVRAQEAIIFEGNTRLVANQRDTQRELAAIQRQNEQEGLQAITAYLEKQYELNTAIQQQNALAESVSSTLGQGMTAAFDSLIKGSDNWGASLQQIASSVLVDIANQLIRIYVIEQAVSAIKSFLSPFNPSTPLGAGGGMAGKFGTFGPNYGIAQRALGGPVSAGTPYMVGERGPELFMPSRGGSIIPNNALGGGGTSVVVNVDASGSSVQGDQAQGRQLGIAISSAVQAELVKQKRPGGLLS
jgi:tape measure domain-containing protein